MTLFQLGDDIRALDDLIEELGGDVSDPQVEAAWLAMAEQLTTDEAAKLDGYVNYIRTLEMEAVAAKAEAEQYAMKARTRENRVKWIKERLKQHLEATGRTKAETATKRAIAIQANGGKPPLILVDNLDPATLPDHLVIIRRTPDTDAIRAALEAGEPLPFASLGCRGTHLRIR